MILCSLSSLLVSTKFPDEAIKRWILDFALRTTQNDVIETCNMGSITAKSNLFLLPHFLLDQCLV